VDFHSVIILSSNLLTTATHLPTPHNNARHIRCAARFSLTPVQFWHNINPKVYPISNSRCLVCVPLSVPGPSLWSSLDLLHTSRSVLDSHLSLSLLGDFSLAVLKMSLLTSYLIQVQSLTSPLSSRACSRARRPTKALLLLLPLPQKARPLQQLKMLPSPLLL
jgi:hypothetical protein